MIDPIKCNECGGILASGTGGHRCGFIEKVWNCWPGQDKHQVGCPHRDWNGICLKCGLALDVLNNVCINSNCCSKPTGKKAEYCTECFTLKCICANSFGILYNCSCKCHQDQEKKDYSHSCCFTSKNPPCGQRIEHLKCCICEKIHPDYYKKRAG